jgi:small-conductance mechanosensitive channel
MLAAWPALAQQPAPPSHGGNPAPAAQAVSKAGAVTPEQARQALDVLQDDAKRLQLINVLKTIAATANNGAATGGAGHGTAPAASPPAASGTPAPATAPASAPAPPASPPAESPTEAPAQGALQADSLGAELMVQAAVWLDDVGTRLAASAHSIADLPRIWHWIQTVVNDPATRNAVISAIWRLGVIIGCALLGEWVVRFVLRRPVSAIERRVRPATTAPADPAESIPSDIDPGDLEPHIRGQEPRPGRDLALLRRIPLAILHFVLDLAPVLAFALIGNALLSTALVNSAVGNIQTIRLAGVALINAYVLTRLIGCVVRLFVQPSAPGLRLLPMTDETGAYVEIWVFRLIATALFGMAVAEITQLFGLSYAGYLTLIKIVSLIVHIYLVIIILQCRRSVGDWLRAKPRRDGTERHGPIVVFRNQLAALWHFFAIFLVMASWVAWAIDRRHGFGKLMLFCLETAAVVVVARLVAMIVLGGFDRLFKIDLELEQRFPGLKERSNRYYALLRGVVTAAIVVLTAIALLQVWGFDAFDWFTSGRIGGRLVSAVITVAIAAIIAVAVWEGANIAIDRHMTRLDRRGDYGHAARLRTLVPILRTVLLILVSIVVIFTLLSEIGVNIAPLLAGASIIGVALGFGSQKLVQDFITGIFLLLENAMQVGDSVTAGGLSGTVEKLSIRTIRLRAGDGAVHIVPFSAVTTVTNVNRGVGNAAVKVTIDAEEDTDRVGDVLKQIALEMREDENFKYAMRSDLQFWGVDDVDGHTATLVGQIVCTDSGRWGVQREFNRRLKKRFAELGIRLAAPMQTVVLRQEEKPEMAEAKESTAEPAGEAHRQKVAEKPLHDEEDKNPTSVRNSPPPTALGHTE